YFRVTLRGTKIRQGVRDHDGRSATAVAYLGRGKMTIGFTGLTGPIVAGIGDPALKRGPESSQWGPITRRVRGGLLVGGSCGPERILDDPRTRLSRGRK